MFVPINFEDLKTVLQYAPGDVATIHARETLPTAWKMGTPLPNPLSIKLTRIAVEFNAEGITLNYYAMFPDGIERYLDFEIYRVMIDKFGIVT